MIDEAQHGSGGAADASLPLAGLRVIDASTLLAAPYAASLLSELGAEVIKVEQPGVGDPARRFRDGTLATWDVTNRNRRGVTLDLHTERGQDLFRRLVAVTDVVIVNFRPQRLEEWGIDYDALSAVRPDIVMLHLSAFGRTGPYADRPGFARVAEAYAGLASITGFPDGDPVLAGYPIVDGIAGLHGAFSVMVALEHRRLTGQGQLIDLALYEPLLRMMEDFVAVHGATGHVKSRIGNAQPHTAPNDLFPTRDGSHVVIPVSTQSMWNRLARTMGLSEDLCARFATNAMRIERRDELRTHVAAFTLQHPAAELVELLQDAEVACAKLNSVSDIVADPHIAARGNLGRYEAADGSRSTLMQAPIPTYSSIRPAVHALGPALSEHTEEVFTDLLGLSAAEIAALREAGVV